MGVKITKMQGCGNDFVILDYEEFLKILRTRTSDLFSSMNEIMRDAFSGQILNDASEGASASVSLIQKYFMDAIKNKLFDFKLAIEEKENKVHYSYKVESNEFEITGLFEFTGTPVGLLEKIAQDDRLNGIIDNPSFADLKEQLKDNNFQEGLKEKFEELMGLIAERLKEQQDDKNLGENEYIMDYADEVIPFGCGAFTKGKKNVRKDA